MPFTLSFARELANSAGEFHVFLIQFSPSQYSPSIFPFDKFLGVAGCEAKAFDAGAKEYALPPWSVLYCCQG